MESKLYKKLLENAKSDFYGFHMPGHKRNVDMVKMENPYLFDITEIDGFDNLHKPNGIIKEEMNIANQFYKSTETYFLINGSSVGNLVAISSVADSGDKIIIARNSHKSVYNAVELLKLKVEYLYPRMIESGDIFGSYNVSDVEDLIKKNKDAKAIVITSPTYEGVVSDIKSICTISHKYEIPVIVDAAHGAHFVLSDKFPKAPLECGADIVIESLHKTLPSLTQTAVLHYNSDLINQKQVEKYLSIYQSTSPSYVLLASICNCIHFAKTDGKMYGEQLIDKVKVFKEKTKNLKYITILEGKNYKEIYDFDCSKIIVMLDKRCSDINFSGLDFKKLLNEKYHLEMEMAAGNYIVAMTTIFDKEQGFDRFEKALQEIDQMLMARCGNYSEDETGRKSQYKSNKNEVVDNKINNISLSGIYGIRNEKKMEIYEAVRYQKKLSIDSANEQVDLEGIASSYTYMYPPGIPIIVPGEVVTAEMKELIEEYEQAGYEVVKTI